MDVTQGCAQLLSQELAQQSGCLQITPAHQCLPSMQDRDPRDSRGLESKPSPTPAGILAALPGAGAWGSSVPAATKIKF